MNKRTAVVLLIALIEIACLLPAIAGLTPNDVVVVYNTYPALNGQSEAVADHYCSARGIPNDNKCAVLWRRLDETIPLDEFQRDIVIPLKTFLQSRFGADPNDPTWA